MSTILDVLKKVEKERESPREQLLHEAEPRPQRRTSVAMIALCAVLGFVTGVGLAFRRGERNPAPALPPEVQASPAAEIPPPPATEAAQLTKIAPPPAEMPAQAPAESGAPTPAPAQPTIVPEAPPQVVGSALEPSPFVPPHEDTAGQPPAQVAAAPHASLPAAADPTPEKGVPPPMAAEAILPAAEPTPEAEPQPEPPKITETDTGRSPPGAPKVLLSFLQWSPDPARRFAFVSVDGSPSQRVREGDTTAGMTVAQITPTGVQLRSEGAVFTIRPRH